MSDMTEALKKSANVRGNNALVTIVNPLHVCSSLCDFLFSD